MDINIRELTTKDMFTVINMLKKLGQTRLTTIFVSDETQKVDGKESKVDIEKTMQLGMTVLSELYEALNQDVIDWFASLCNLSVDEYLETPIDTTNQIIEYLVESEKTKDFFSHASQVYKKIALLKSPLKTK